MAGGPAALGGSELSTCWALSEVGWAVGYPGREGVGREGAGSAASPCTCSSIVCLEEMIKVWSLYSGRTGGGFGLGVYTLDLELPAVVLRTCFFLYPRGSVQV